MSPETQHRFAPTEISDWTQVAWVTLGNITYIDGALRDAALVVTPVAAGWV